MKKKNDVVFISPREAAEIIGIGLAAARKLCRERPHGFPAVKSGTRFLVNKKLLYVWCDKIVTEDVAVKT